MLNLRRTLAVMQSNASTESRGAGLTERLDARVTATVKRRLDVLALLEGRSASAVLSGLLDEKLPPIRELAARLVESEPAEAAAA